MTAAPRLRPLLAGVLVLAGLPNVPLGDAEAQTGTVTGVVIAREKKEHGGPGTTPETEEPVTIRRNPWLSGADLHVYADGRTVLVRPDGERVPLTVTYGTCPDCWPGPHELTFYRFPDGMTIVERPHGSQWEVRYPEAPPQKQAATPEPAPTPAKGAPTVGATISIDLKDLAVGDVTPGVIASPSVADAFQYFFGRVRRLRLDVVPTRESRFEEETAPGGALEDDEGPLELYLTSRGTSTGAAFDATFVPTSGGPVELVETTVVLEPVRLDEAGQRRHAQLADEALAEHPGAVRETLEAYCLEFTKEVPAAGMVFRLAPPAVQQRFAGMRSVLASAERLFQEGGLHPDSDPREYFHSTLQWAIWSRQEGFDRGEFTEAFLEHARKNFEAAGEPWTNDVRRAIEGLLPNRWKDVQAVLAAAGTERSSASPNSLSLSRAPI